MHELNKTAQDDIWYTTFVYYCVYDADYKHYSDALHPN